MSGNSIDAGSQRLIVGIDFGKFSGRIQTNDLYG